ncbi:hypothetical protein AC249_AIPGENE17642 [Exaiptasia diaphana]|nr:hypothetical protein AC249_AIPGENE17642 [Exaiptasia diaphana]
MCTAVVCHRTRNCLDECQKGPMWSCLYATGLITRKYAKGQEISVKIRITANHQGWFEFRVGDIGTPPITQAKFTYLLKTPDGKTRVPLRGYGSSLETIKLRLPADLTCRQCVLQWWWKVGNSWGCEMVNGKKKCGLGYGPQETFVNCADIQIGDGGGLPPPTPTGVPPPPPPPAQEPPQPPPPTNLPYPYGLLLRFCTVARIKCDHSNAMPIIFTCLSISSMSSFKTIFMAYIRGETYLATPLRPKLSKKL